MLEDVILRRVRYGKEDTPIDKREYCLGPGYPVGCIAELKDFYKGKAKRLILFDKRGQSIEQEVEL